MKEPETMNEDTDTKEPQTESPAKATPGADHVFQVFKDIGTPVTMLVWAAVAMLLVFCVGSVVVLPSILVLIAFPLVPGIIVNREFRDEVIPTCRNVCPETEIVSGALKSLGYLWERYFLCLFPGIMIVVGLAVYYYGVLNGMNFPIGELGGAITMCMFVSLVGDFALAVYPVARLFSYRIGMNVMLGFVILGQIVLLSWVSFGVSPLFFIVYLFSEGSSSVGNDYTAVSCFLSFLCLVPFVGGLGYFIHAAYTDAKEKGMLY